MSEIKVDVIIDTKGLACPMPVLKTKNALKTVKSGQILQVIATDPASRADIPAFVERLGHKLIEVREEDCTISFLIRKR